MLITSNIVLTCPACGASVPAQRVLKAGRCSAKSTDFQEMFPTGNDPIVYQVAFCARCGYAGKLHAFDESDDVRAACDAEMQRWLATLPEFYELPSPSEKWERAARVAERSGIDSHELAEHWHRAAWCAREADDVEAERYYLRFAAWEYGAALQRFDGVPRDERAVTTYLVGEIWRRVGDLRASRHWLELVGGEITDAKAQGWVVELAQQQATYPREVVL